MEFVTIILDIPSILNNPFFYATEIQKWNKMNSHSFLRSILAKIPRDFHKTAINSKLRKNFLSFALCKRRKLVCWIEARIKRARLVDPCEMIYIYSYIWNILWVISCDDEKYPSCEILIISCIYIFPLMCASEW